MVYPTCAAWAEGASEASAAVAAAGASAEVENALAGGGADIST